jgi:hypothetical protein
MAQVKKVLEDAKDLGTVEWIYFEGGEPFLYHPIMVEGMSQARAMGFKTGVVTNCFWATAVEDAKLWLNPVLKTGIEDLSLSDDAFHHGEAEETPAKRAAAAASQMGLPVSSICIEKPTIQAPADGKGDPVVGGGALFKGRAVEKLAPGLPTKPPETFCECTHEELVAPKRVHIDSYGHVQVCQGVSIGNMWEKPISELISEYDASTHPICGPIIRGGPAELAKTYDVETEAGYVDECHLCFAIRKALIDRFPQYLAPRQVYGLTEEEE